MRFLLSFALCAPLVLTLIFLPVLPNSGATFSFNSTAPSKFYQRGEGNIRFDFQIHNDCNNQFFHRFLEVRFLRNSSCILFIDYSYFLKLEEDLCQCNQISPLPSLLGRFTNKHLNSAIVLPSSTLAFSCVDVIYSVNCLEYSWIGVIITNVSTCGATQAIQIG